MQAPSPNGTPDGAVLAVALGRFEPLIGLGLEAALADDEGIRLVPRHGSHPDSVLDRDLSGSVPSIVIIDEMSGGETAQRLRTDWEKTEVVVIAKDPTLAYARVLAACGVSCVASNISPKELLLTVREAAKGGRVFVASDGGYVKWCQDDADLFSARERQVFHLLSQGMDYARTAHALQIARRTVEAHGARIYRKLGVTSKREALDLFSRPWFGVVT